MPAVPFADFCRLSAGVRLHASKPLTTWRSRRKWSGFVCSRTMGRLLGVLGYPLGLSMALCSTVESYELTVACPVAVSGVGIFSNDSQSARAQKRLAKCPQPTIMYAAWDRLSVSHAHVAPTPEAYAGRCKDLATNLPCVSTALLGQSQHYLFSHDAEASSPRRGRKHETLSTDMSCCSPADTPLPRGLSVC